MSISIVTGDNGLLSQAQKASSNYNKSKINEKLELVIANQKIAKMSGNNISLEEELVKEGLLKEEDLSKSGLIELNDNSNKNIFIIKDVEGFKQLSQNVNNGQDYNGIEFYVINDIDFGATFNSETGALISGEKFIPIGNSSVKVEDENSESAVINKFQGKVIGNGYSLKNLYISDEGNNNFCVAFIGYLGENGEISDLIIENTYIYGSGYETASFVGRNRGEVKKCINKGEVFGNFLTGGIVGRNLNLIDSCVNDGKVYSSNYQTGGIVGNCDVLGNDLSINVVVKNCVNNATLSSTGSCLGGIVGGVWNKDIVIQECSNSGQILGEYYGVGGIVGRGSSSISNCINTGLVETNAGDRSSAAYCGGIVGCAESNSLVSKCHNSGNITGTGAGVGGICGSCSGVISTSYNNGSVGNDYKLSLQVGGIVGKLYGVGKLEYVYNFGKVQADNKIGGIVGVCVANDEESPTVKQCYNIGNVLGTTNTNVVTRKIASICGCGWTNAYEFSSCYYLNLGLNGVYESNVDIEGVVEGKNINELKLKSTYNGWDFDTIWNIDEGKGTPTLK